MICEKAFEIDLAAFLVDAAAPEFTQFREHYPLCRICSAEVQAWTELHRKLEAGGAMKNGSHPEEDLLLRFEEQPSTLPSAQREAVESHLSTCHSCRDELQTLRSFDFAALGHVVRKPRQRWWRRIADFASVTRGVVLHPAFAYGLVILLLLPTVVGRFPIPDFTSPSEQPVALDEMSTVLREREADSLTFSVQVPPAENRILAQRSSERRSRVLARREQSAAGAARLRAGGGSDTVRFGEQASQQGSYHLKEAAPVAEESFTQAFVDVSGLLSAEADKPTEQRWPTAVLQVGEPLEISQTSLDEGLKLQIPLPHEADKGSEVEVRVLDPDRRRELRERVAAPVGAHYVYVGVPAAWLSPGRYRVELHVVETPQLHRIVREFAFTVRRPDPPPEVRRVPAPSASEEKTTRSQPASRPQ